jgi:hypothetical protein
MLSMMRALWDQVTRDLRGVAVSYQGSVEHGSIEARFLYEGAVGDVQAECASLDETHCIADFPPGVSVMFRPVPTRPATYCRVSTGFSALRAARLTSADAAMRASEQVRLSLARPRGASACLCIAA